MFHLLREGSTASVLTYLNPENLPNFIAIQGILVPLYIKINFLFITAGYVKQKVDIVHFVVAIS